ncbi:hypothetical protein [Nocardioides sp.]|uniref:hypothetical protein n=1 Tax=Nocardioides sp. TaxID=35761 RepID=UPI002B276BC3|nr:hypothetical protein [Nocardioides sp.]
MRRRIMLPPLLLALVVGLGACSGDPEPIIEPAPSATATASPTSEPTPTAESVGESAKQFIRRWQMAAFEMQRTGDTGDYREMTQACESCNAFVDTVESIYGDGGSISLEEPSVVRIEKVGQSSGTSIYEFDTVTSATTVVDAKGKVSQRLEGGRTRYQVNLDRPDEVGWRVTRISELV